MGIIEFFIICVVIGVVIWLIHAFTPIPKPIKTIILWAGVLARALGLWGHDIAIPKVK
jgi:hypothetical protein